MKHNEPIRPMSTAEPISAMPDRTNLSMLYPEVNQTAKSLHGNSSRGLQEEALPDARPMIINRVVVSLLLFVPVLSTCLLVLYVSRNALANPPIPLASLYNFYATGVCLLLCALAFRALAKQFSKSNVSVSIFTAVYLFYLFPTLKLTFGLLQGDSIGVIIGLSILLVLTHFAVFYMTWALNRQASSYGNRMLVVALPILILMVSASLF